MKKQIAAVVLSLGLIIAGTNVAFAKAKKADTLYNRLGGKKAITAVVDDFVGNCASDARINSFFAKTAADTKRLQKFKANLVDQICEAAGGPCKYKGKSMKEAHAGMGVKSADFGALVEDLVKSLDKFQVAKADKDTLLGVLGPMKSDIVEEKAASNETANAPKPE